MEEGQQEEGVGGWIAEVKTAPSKPSNSKWTVTGIYMTDDVPLLEKQKEGENSRLMIMVIFANYLAQVSPNFLNKGAVFCLLDGQTVAIGSRK